MPDCDRSRLMLGLEVALEEPPAILSEGSFGLLLNAASVNRDFEYAHLLLAQRFPGRLRALFGPQHGLWCEQQDNMIETPHGRDPRTGLPVYSLYAERRKPEPGMLEGLDALVVDLQDVGTRVYTFIWTLSLCLEACAHAGIPAVILDRPNPLGGAIVEGPALEPGFESFVGRAPIPMRHALTVGEMALHLNRTMSIGARIEIVRLRGWQRDQLWSDTARPWVPTSPNLPRFEGVLLYPGQVLLEGTRLSEGRGTTTPFEICGAPWIDPWRLADALRARELPGITARPLRFEPTFNKHADASCGGLFLHPTDARALRSYAATLALLATLRNLWPDDFRWLDPPYEYETERMPIDILSGSAALREAIDGGTEATRVADLARVDVAAWSAATAPDRLYGDDPDPFVG